MLMCIWEYEEREKVGVCVREGAGREGRDRERQRSIGCHRKIDFPFWKIFTLRFLRYCEFVGPS